MNLEELRSTQDAERKRSDLQPLRESFYEEAGEYIADLKSQRDRAASEADDPFGSSEVRRLTDEIETAEEVVEAIYERRLGKLVERASLAAADMSVDEDGLTAEEQALFTDLVDRMEASKRTVLDTLDPETETPTPGTDQPDPDRLEATTDTAAPADDGVSAADLMGDGSTVTDGGDADATSPAGGPPETDPSPSPAPSRSPTEDPDPAPDGVDLDATVGRPGADGDDGHGHAETDGPDAGPDQATTLDRVTVRITRDVGEILGVDDRQYDLAAEDVVRLPATNADPLVQRGAAERLD
jgi:DNA replication factor GINS